MTPLLDTKGVAVHLGCSERTVRNYVKERGLPAKRIGPRLVRFDIDEIEAWLADQQPAEPEATQPRPPRRAAVQLIP